MGKSLELRKQEALERQQKRNKRSPQEQIAILDKKFGKDIGSAKERARLAVFMKTPEEKIKEEKPKKRKKKKNE